MVAQAWFPPTRPGPGRTITVHTGRGANTPQHRYWGQDYYIWNNTGDTATLRNKAGLIIDRCTWETGVSGTTGC